MRINILRVSARIALRFSFIKISVNLFFIVSKLRVEVFKDLAIVILVAMKIWLTSIRYVQQRLGIG